jgi:hypothetical protein
MVKEYWASCKTFTVWVQTDQDTIVDIAPIGKSWKWQSFRRFCAYYHVEKVELTPGKGVKA